MASLQKQTPRKKELSNLLKHLCGNPRCLDAAGGLEVGDQVLALGGLLDTGEDHLGTLYFRIGEERSGDMM